MEKGNAPNFDLPKDAYFDGSDVASETFTPGSRAALSTPQPPPDDRERGWSSALFPAKPTQPEPVSGDARNGDRDAEESRAPRPATGPPKINKSPADDLFVPRSAEHRP